MCGIVGGVSERNVTPILFEGLKRLEYRGYDSAGIAIRTGEGDIQRVRVEGKVAELETKLQTAALDGQLGIGHTRWATHGKPSEYNAHPHICQQRVALVHNGIIENHAVLREKQAAKGHKFTSDTDTEVIVHQIYDELRVGHDLLTAVKNALVHLDGAYAFGVIDAQDPESLVAACQGSPLVIGVGLGENYIASDVFALLPITSRFIFPEEGDVICLSQNDITIIDKKGQRVEREIRESSASGKQTQLGNYSHYMQKEIFEQPAAIIETLEGRMTSTEIISECFGLAAKPIFAKTRRMKIIACGTSYHAGMVARYWIENLANISCQVEIASEYRYRNSVVEPDTLLVSVSQSGETADTLAALHKAKASGYLAALAICNVAESTLARQSDLVFLTHAGPEIGVASTKAFTTQLVALLLLVAAIIKEKGGKTTTEQQIVKALRQLPSSIERILDLDDQIKKLAQDFKNRNHALFLGRGDQYPIAMEGALKLKEISYIHAEAYPAGELKHGPLALIDEKMPVIAVAPDNALFKKLKSNLEEVRARGGELFVFVEKELHIEPGGALKVLEIPRTNSIIAPILFTVPLQLLAYHVAVLRGTDVDQPRNLAKSVTVE